MPDQLSRHLAKHLRDVHTGGNWTVSNLKDQLEGISQEQALMKVGSLNTIAALTYHIHYFVHAVLPVLKGKSLEAHDKFSFDHPPINTEKDWKLFKEKVFREADELADLIEQLPESKMWENFTEEKYGNWFRNLNGIIEHTHYHLGQIALIKKLVIENVPVK